MKNNSLIALGLIAFLAMAWYRVVLLPAETEASARELKTEARDNAEKGAPELAIKLFDQALKVKDTLEDRQEVFRYYKQCLEDNSIEFDSRSMQKFVTSTMDMYADKETAYEMAMDFWKEEGNFQRCASVMDQAIANNAVSEQLQRDFNEIKYTYRVSTSRYYDIMPYSDGIQPVKNGESWLYFDEEMRPIFEKELSTATPCNQGMIAIQNDSTVKLVSTDGKVQQAVKLDAGVELAGAYGNNYIPIHKDGKYAYIDVTGENNLGEYDYAGVFCNKRVAVRQGEDWKVLNSVGEVVLSASDIALDEVGRCAMGEKIVAKVNGTYGIYSTKGELLANLDVDFVKGFGEDTLATACKDGKWGYIDLDGNWVIQPSFDDARSFSNGFGAVCKEGLWGFIDAQGIEAIECQFEDVSAFTDGGKCMIKSEGLWKSVELLCK